MPTATVENYLKALYRLGPKAAGNNKAMAPMGELARSVGVTPGTATLMIKRLADRGLVRYEPRSGAALTRKGNRAALDVLRRHRLIEQFLVQIVGLDWSEVHEEAEVLEHAISERLLQRIDDMLGNPEYDPHGDPIPAASGKLARRTLVGLDEAAPGPARVARITDHSPDFLRFIDQQGLAPDTAVHITERDAAADTVTLQRADGQAVQLGQTAAAKILVEVG
jgi:DtxR family Mn-dependent transcriptional regulator